MRFPLRWLGLAVCVSALCASAADHKESKPLTKILFGSCIKQEHPVPIFKHINARQPDLFLFLGDNIYGDTEDMQVLRQKYSKLGDMPGFRTLRKATPIMATWDDHDYGINDGGAAYPKRVQSQTIFNDFWKLPAAAPQRHREGVYDARVFGPHEQSVQIIMLDTRYFRAALKRGPRRTGGPYYPDPNPALTLLGDAQWKWLEQQLKIPARLRIIATSIQCIPEAAGQETWSNLPTERARLFDLIRTTQANGVILISGDRHWSELSKTQKSVPYPVHELTSSGLNQIHPRGTPTKNLYRADKSTYHKENYGAILINWATTSPHVTLQIRDASDQVRIQKKLSLSDLQ
ncbi:MAG: alkaline phosphatase D family protein [Verrucomicrobiia bacterium]|jgi:alkaline phosphatase D